MEPSKFDKTEFEQKIALVIPSCTFSALVNSLSASQTALRVPKKDVGQCIQALRGHLLSRPSARGVKGNGQGWKTVQDDPDSADGSVRLVILNEGEEVEALPAAAAAFVKEKGFERVPYTLTLGYEHCSVETVLKKLLPEGCDIPSSFETVGHIAHLNLRDEHKGYEGIIGQVLLDKNPKLKTVVNKTETLCHTVFRVFQMEVGRV